MKQICKNCQFQRKQGEMDAAVPGKGYWCSNSQSKLFMHRVVHENTCEKFAERWKKAGLFLRAKVKGLGLVNKVLKGRK